MKNLNLIGLGIGTLIFKFTKFILTKKQTIFLFFTFLNFILNFSTIIGTGTVIVNASGVPPVVRVRIIDLSANNKEANETQLGQELQFRIDVDPANGKCK